MAIDNENKRRAAMQIGKTFRVYPAPDGTISVLDQRHSAGFWRVAAPFVAPTVPDSVSLITQACRTIALTACTNRSVATAACADRSVATTTCADRSVATTACSDRTINQLVER